MEKQTPKSCSCEHCRRSKASDAGNYAMKREERRYRHRAKQKLARVRGDEDDEVLDGAPSSSPPG